MIISPPVLVLCLAEATGSGGAGWSSWHYQVDHPIARRRARARHARVTHSTGRAVHAARNARDDAREWLLAFETTSSLAVARHCSPNNSSADISRRMCRAEIHASFPSRGAPHFALGLENGGAGSKVQSTTTLHRPSDAPPTYARNSVSPP